MVERQDQVPGMTHRMHIWIWSSPYPLSPGYWRAVAFVHACANTLTPTTSDYFGFTLVGNMKMYEMLQYFVGQEKRFADSDF